ncbi:MULTISPECIES: 4-hydroxyphenylacetate 3-hydroxylase N-terminal domain-containing protein [unclassified Nocardioides]|uniref:4-hydroxyphenylacetate 3-hydroxylase N-terminal domain-containing protein n=1 Tax=unclassified Nocardioides TaxID=2615069 RepID=UPI0009F0374D|nr:MULTISPECIES: 4-hydroxyphenylacetate 3-hydroxylase N-terminal domain-containing protein [unclassified Nocardioides]GAW48997.1 Putative 4-hydroxyphenylacetate-3-hydroxylase [Nocardioides sp. PD653-B2]GAW55212.1 putative 4-hydroxyphenylacetate-3-hydroxylase [Nocardioides sp. PD653]
MDTIENLQKILTSGPQPHLLTGEQYKASLRDGRQVFDDGAKVIDDVTEHPVTRRAVDTYAKIMDLQFNESTQDIVTFVDTDGQRKARGWQVPRNRDDLEMKRRQIGVANEVTLGVFGRPPEYGPAMSLGFMGVIDRIERENEQFAENIRNFIDMSARTNLLSTDLIADAQSDRSVPRMERPGTLRVVGETDDYVVLRGSKVAGSSGPNVHFFTLSSVLGEGLGPDAAIWAAVPVNLPGISLLMRPRTSQQNINSFDNPIGVLGEESDQFIFFDDVELPKKYVFSLRNLDLLTAFFDTGVYALWHILTRLSFRAELFAGTAQVLVEALGTDKIPAVRRTVADISAYAQVLKSFSFAAVDRCEEWNGVAVPNPSLVSAGRYYSITEYDNVISKLRDLAGQGLVSRWSKDVWDSPEFSDKLGAYLPGHDVSAREKNLISNFVWDMTSSLGAARLGHFEKVNATPPAAVAEIVYQSADRSTAAEFVRNYLREAAR